MKGGHQRGALAVGCDIRAAKVGDNIHAGQRGNDFRITELLGIGLRCIGGMINGLPVAADGDDIGRGYAGRCKQSVGGIRKGMANGTVQFRQIGAARVLQLDSCSELPAQGVG